MKKISKYLICIIAVYVASSVVAIPYFYWKKNVMKDGEKYYGHEVAEGTLSLCIFVDGIDPIEYERISKDLIKMMPGDFAEIGETYTSAHRFAYLFGSCAYFRVDRSPSGDVDTIEKLALGMIDSISVIIDGREGVSYKILSSDGILREAIIAEQSSAGNVG